MLRDGLPRRSEAAQVRWSDVEFREDGAALLHLPQSKTDQEAEGTVLYIGRAAAQTLQVIRPCGQLYDANLPVFGLSARQIGRRVHAAAKTAGRWNNSRMPARCTERQAAGRGAVARYYQERED